MLDMPFGPTLEVGCAARLLSADSCMPSGASDVSTDAGTNASSDARSSTASNASARLVAAMRGSGGLAADSEESSPLRARAPPRRRNDALGLLPGLRGPTRPVRACRPRPVAEVLSPAEDAAAPSSPSARLVAAMGCGGQQAPLSRSSMGSQALLAASPAAGVAQAAVESVEWQVAGGRNGAASLAARLVEAMGGSPRAQASTPPSRKKSKSVAFALLDEGSAAAADSLDALQAEQQLPLSHGLRGSNGSSPMGSGAGSRSCGSLLQEQQISPTTGAGGEPTRHSAYHDPNSASQNVGNHVGSRSTVRQSKLFRMYESGNAAKAILGQDSLQWNVNLKEGAYHGRVFDAYEGHNSCAAGAADGREARKGGRGSESPSLWMTTAGAYGAG